MSYYSRLKRKNRIKKLLSHIPKKQRNYLAGILCAFLFVCIVAVVWIVLSHKSVPTSEINVSFSDNENSLSIVECAAGSIPEYNSKLWITLNDDVPLFTANDIQTIHSEIYSELDKLGRCGKATALLSKELMPTERRGEIGQIKPSGWKQEKYPGIVDSDPPFLYNRCHLIAFALTGQNANEKNLITGTRYFNVEGMLPFEMRIIEYIEESGNHVLYRVTPLFRGKELVARGVEMEALSIEDQGQGLSFHVFVYNIQPGVEIDYYDGSSKKQKNSL